MQFTNFYELDKELYAHAWETHFKIIRVFNNRIISSISWFF